ncbi:MAG: response regulator [Dictyoglomaceae bacterium]|nr:response regulator [Dictyoglomaceae bacterium]
MLPSEEERDILIVEDSPTQAEYLRKILRDYGYSSFVALSGEEALELLKTKIPQVVISDIVMPGIDGYELCGKIKSDEKLKNIIVLLLTVLSDPKDIIRGLEVGADGFITKPFDTKYLISTLQFLISSRELKKLGTIESVIEINILGKRYRLYTTQIQILNLLLQSYEKYLEKNEEIEKLKEEINKLNKELKLLYEKDKEYEYLIEGIPLPIFVVKDIGGEILTSNSYVSLLLKKDKEEIIGKNLFELLKLSPLEIAKLREVLLSPKEKRTCKIKGNICDEEVELECIGVPIIYNEKPAIQLTITIKKI